MSSLPENPRYRELRKKLESFRSHSFTLGKGIGSLTISIAGIPVLFRTSSVELTQRLKEYFQEYLIPDTTPDLSLNLITEHHSELWEDDSSDFSTSEGFVFHRDFVATPLTESSTLALLPEALDDSIHNLLRWVLPPVLLKQRRFLMHAAGVIRDGRGYVFFGQSGAGKSTTTKLVTDFDPSVTAVGDDAVILGFPDSSSGPYLYSAPLGCGYSRKAPPALAVPVAGIFALQQAPAHRVSRLSRSEAVARILGSAMTLTPDWQVSGRFELATEIATREPFIELLELERNPKFWPMLLNRR